MQLLNRLVDPVDPAVGTPRHYCTRWKAVCVRMNLSVLEDWVRVNTNATVTMTMDGDISPTASIQSPVSPMLQHLSKHSSMPGTSAAPATRERRGFEGLLQPLSHTHPDAITSYLSPLITAVQLYVCTCICV